MIWFSCKKCSKTHNRPESSAGTMVFCECGQGLTVPWESSAAPPAAPPIVASAPRGPDLGPIQFDPVTIAGGSAATPTSRSGGSAASSSAYDEDDRSYRRGRGEKRDPDFCFNHQRRPKTQACAECGQGFCADCLVKYQNGMYCGPCKNFLSRRTELPPTASSIASASLIISLIAGPLTMCLLLWKPESDPFRILSWLSLLPQVVALALGAWALRDAEKEKKGGGQWVALSGVAAASLTCVLMLLLNLFASRLV
ncbi:MAG: hypothetical protein HY289_08175 [Planctomycetes bacterium]|nr:hypothetical protein [Planctomycetota bacterium]